MRSTALWVDIWDIEMGRHLVTHVT